MNTVTVQHGGPGHKPTVFEVAQAAGVSIASVSRVLNGKSTRKHTTEKVRRAAEELGYLPDGAGRALKLGRNLHVAFVVDDVANPVYTQMMRGVEAALAGARGSEHPRLLISSTGHEPTDLLEVVRGLSTGYADGLLISPLVRSPELMDALAAAPVPVVIIGHPEPGYDFDTVTVDSRAGVRLAFEHLIATRRSRIALVNGPSRTAPGGRRLDAYLAACDRAGVEPTVVEAADFSVDAGERAFSRLRRRRGPLPSAVLAANDTLALGVARSALNAGVAIPQDLAITGIDDIDFARVFSPSLTTVTLHAHRRGELAAQLLLERLADPRKPPRTAKVVPKLVVRESTTTRRRGARPTRGQG